MRRLEDWGSFELALVGAQIMALVCLVAWFAWGCAPTLVRIGARRPPHTPRVTAPARSPLVFTWSPSATTQSIQRYPAYQCSGTASACPSSMPALWAPVGGFDPATACTQSPCQGTLYVAAPASGAPEARSYYLTAAADAESDPSNVVQTVVGPACGDVNGDGATNIGDALLVAQYDVGSRSCAQLVHHELCDVNHDGACNIGDALRLAQCDVGLTGCDFACTRFVCP